MFICVLFVKPKKISFPFSFILFFFIFVGIDSANPQDILLVDIGELRGSKDLLHMLNATVNPKKLS